MPSLSSRVGVSSNGDLHKAAAKLAEWDAEALAALKVRLRGHRSLSGPEIVARRVAELERESAAEEVVAPPADAVTRLGDVWLLGRHRLLCGDATSRADVAKLLAGAKPGIMVTDPPYGVEYDPNWRNDAEQAGYGKAPGGRAVGVVHNDGRVDWRDAWSLFPGAVVYVWHAAVHAANVQRSIEAAGFVVRYQIIWAKHHIAIGRGDYHWQHEPLWYAVRDGSPCGWCGDRSQTTLWHIAKNQKNDTGHSTQKPVECMERPLRNHAALEVYDPFVGSGTTIIAAERTGRTCYAMELSPAYCDVAVRRWEAFTGQKAQREGGETAQK